MGKKNQIKISQEKRLESIEKELYEAMNILDNINKRINDALKTELQTKEDLTNLQNSSEQSESTSSSLQEN